MGYFCTRCGQVHYSWDDVDSSADDTDFDPLDYTGESASERSAARQAALRAALATAAAAAAAAAEEAAGDAGGPQHRGSGS